MDTVEPSYGGLLSIPDEVNRNIEEVQICNA